MDDFRQDHLRNTLLKILAPEDFALLQPHLASIAIDHGFSLSRPDQVIKGVYFPESGLASITTGSASFKVEVGIIGREGVVGVPIILGTDRSPYDVFGQMPGRFLHISTAAFKAAMARSASMQAIFLLYAQAFLVQTASTAVANSRFNVNERLARWILMCHDRAEGDEINVTHEFLAMMLGIRRSGVTVATHILEGERLIRAGRGRIVVIDRAGLERRAEESYGTPEAEYERLFRAERASRRPGAPPYAAAAL